MRVAIISMWLVLGACGGSSDGGDNGGDGAGAPDANEGARYFPLAVGSSWTYQVIDTATGSSALKTQTVEALEDVGGDRPGVTAFRLRSEKDAGYTVSWQEDTGTAVIRHREQTFDAADTQETEEWFTPGKLRLDESADRLELGATYSETYTESTTDLATDMTITTTKTEQWTVEAVDEEITVPAGTFACLRVLRTNEATGVQKRYWFARGVGKVKEEGAGHTELLAE